MSIPVRRQANPLFGQPTLRAVNNGLTEWIRGETSPLDQKSSTGWLAKLTGGVQTGDDWARINFPVDEIFTHDFNYAQWSWYQTAAQTMGLGIVIWVHDPNDFDKRAEVTQLGGHADLPKAAGWNAFKFTPDTAGMFFYGENTTGTALTAGTQYAWSSFQGDVLFRNWTIYRITLEWGWEASGTFQAVYVADVKLNGVAVPVKPSAEGLIAITKTVETELIGITAVAADVQSISSTLDLSGQVKGVTILIDHAKDHASASVGQGTEYVIQVSEKASGNDTWRSLVPFTAAITAPTAVATDAEEAAGQTVIECGATVPAVGDIIFFKNATIANSEWANVIARVTTGGSETFTIESGLTNAQAASTYYTQGEHFVSTIDVKAVTRLRVICNNTKGTTNRAICWRCAAITYH